MTYNESLKKPVNQDWHSVDVIAALHKKGISFSWLAIENGYTHKNSLTQVLRKPYPAAEKIVAKALGLKPEQIWPSRYNTDGTTNRIRGRQPMRPYTVNVSTSKPVGNTQKTKAA